MWLTGFDAPSLHTMYVDKPMRGHGLMQAIARVNRVFRDKPGGLVVDYLGLAHELKAALATYTESGGTGRTALDQDEAVALMLEKHEVCCALFHRLRLDEVGRPGHPQSGSVCSPRRRSTSLLDHAVRQIISRAVAPGGVIDIFAAAGLDKPDVSILSDEFLAEVRGMPQRNLAVELLEKLLKGELAKRRRKNVVQARSFAEMLEQTVRRYQSRAIEASQVIEELIALAKEIRDSRRPRRSARPERRRAGVLRRTGDERQRSQGAR